MNGTEWRRPEPERAILVSLVLSGTSTQEADDTLRELALLAETAGAVVVNHMVQRRDRPDPALYLGEGKLAELHILVHEEDADLVICDDELSGVQARNIEEKLGVRVIDRTQLILDIFAQRARTKEAQLQVELAQLSYMLPRLIGRREALSRLGGGIGTRGPGETKLEVDRRHIRKRMADLNDSIEEVRHHRALQRKSRVESGLPLVALVGYTNAGKSTLLNALTNAGVLAEDKLFATLDPTVRRVTLPDDRTALVSDTVGFIRKLPHELVASFRATLEEAANADLLLHVVDASHPGIVDQMAAVREVLGQLEVDESKVLTVFNKLDAVPSDYQRSRLRIENPGSVAISAATGEGIEDLLSRISGEFAGRRRRVHLLLPYSRAGLIGEIREQGRLLKEEYLSSGIEVIAEIDRVLADRLSGFEVDKRGGPKGGEGAEAPKYS
jgi:GTP-binding protein HflX